MFMIFNTRTSAIANLSIDGIRKTLETSPFPMLDNTEKNFMSLKPGEYCYHGYFVIIRTAGGVSFNSR